jgi:putative ABC transport system permease protein
MLRNYLKIALRTLNRHRAYAFINLAGLAVGLAACLLIFLFVRDELSYDRFHDKADRIYRVVSYGKQLSTSALLAPSLVANFPEVESAVRLSRRWGEALVTQDGGVGLEAARGDLSRQ